MYFQTYIFGIWQNWYKIIFARESAHDTVRVFNHRYNTDCFFL